MLGLIYSLTILALIYIYIYIYIYIFSQTFRLITLSQVRFWGYPRKWPSSISTATMLTSGDTASPVLTRYTTWGGWCEVHHLGCCFCCCLTSNLVQGVPSAPGLGVRSARGPGGAVWRGWGGGRLVDGLLKCVCISVVFVRLALIHFYLSSIFRRFNCLKG